MHNLEVNKPGYVRGWVAGSDSGVPGHIEIVAPGARCRIAATVERPDVLRAGHTLFSGFDLTLSIGVPCAELALVIGNRSYPITAEVRADDDIARIDARTFDGIEGWVDHDVPLSALLFSDGEHTEFPDILPRADVASHKGVTGSDRFGFRLSGERLETLKFCVINSSHVHVFGAALLSRDVAA